MIEAICEKEKVLMTRLIAERLRGFIIAFGISSLPMGAPAQELSALPPELAQKVEQAVAACADFENGMLSLKHGAVHRIDLDGDLGKDWVLDEAGLVCSSAISLFCGSGGCLSHFLVDGHIASLLNQGWSIVTFGPHRTLLADVHGTQCDGINPTPCVTASVWDSDQSIWRSANAQWE